MAYVLLEPLSYFNCCFSVDQSGDFPTKFQSSIWQLSSSSKDRCSPAFIAETVLKASLTRYVVAPSPLESHRRHPINVHPEVAR